jgi:hypothetical protein
MSDVYCRLLTWRYLPPMGLLTIPRLLDIFAILSALLAAWLWYRAGSCPARRMSLTETINAQDFNRIVTAINRAGILNRRAAFATALSGVALALKFAHDLLLS